MGMIDVYKPTWGGMLRIQNQTRLYNLEEFAVKDKKSNLVE